jgi:serine/threonine protein kinase
MHSQLTTSQQLLNGLCFLMSVGLTHRSLSCHDVLLSSQGTVKVGLWLKPKRKRALLMSATGCPERYVACDPRQSDLSYTRSFPSIVMCLMQKYEKDKGVIGVDDLERWPVGSDAFEFLSATSSISSLNDLKEVRSA